VILGTLALAGLSACGSEAATEVASSETATEQSTNVPESSSVTGSYKVETTTEEGMDAFTLTLKDDGAFTLTHPDPSGGEDVGIGGTYTVEGDKIGMTNDEGSESDTGAVKGDRLVFETITWVRQ
jgi:hypothetical protein